MGKVMVPVKLRSSKKGKRSATARAGVARTAAPSGNPFGPVSTINTAPVAIGNSLSGFKTSVIQTKDGVRVIGRDYAFTSIATGTVITWALCGGLPLTPACMPSTVLRNYCQMYNKFKFNTCLFHYITSSGTSTTGDIVFYHQKNADSSMANYTSSSFLPFVLSDSQTVIGPQWTNHTIKVTPVGPFRSTDYGMNVTSEDYTQGDVFLLSKTSSTESPGYVIFDYDITFKELSVNPRAGTLPSIKAQWTPFSCNSTTVCTSGTTAPLFNVSGTTGIGGTTINTLSNQAGDVFKVIIDVTNSTFSAATSANIFKFSTNGNTEAYTILDGFTCYAVVYGTNSWSFYSTLTNAITNTNPIVAGVTATYNETLRGLAKLVSWQDGNLQNAY